MDFEQQLKAYCTDKNPYLRPFGPNPHWKQAQVFIVGTNPATPMRDEFTSPDEYWDSLTKSPDIFECKYNCARGHKISKTSKNIKKLCVELPDVNLLITNASAFPCGPHVRVPLAERERGKWIFKELVNLCQPRVIFAHGQKAQRLIESEFDIPPLDPYVPDKRSAEVNGALLLCAPHMSGLGIRKGKTFCWDEELPKYAQIIRQAVIH